MFSIILRMGEIEITENLVVQYDKYDHFFLDFFFFRLYRWFDVVASPSIRHERRGDRDRHQSGCRWQRCGWEIKHDPALL